MEAKEKILEETKSKGVRFVSLEFVDIFGNAKACEITINQLERTLDEGLWFDGSSVYGFVRIHESDMFLKPDLDTFAVLPWTDDRVARILCDVYIDEKTPFDGDPRYALKRMLKKAGETGFDYRVGPELEFFFFRDGNSDDIKPLDDASYFDVAPKDPAVDAKRDVVSCLERMGMVVEMSHHEVAGGQHEIDFKYGNALAIADSVLTYKTTVKTIGKKHGLYASFMPKPVFGVNGSGMHVHQSLWKGDENAFYDGNDPYNLSDAAKGFIAGQLFHARALSGVVAPTVNSYKRLVPGYEAPAYVCWGRVNRSALIRIPAARNKSGIRAELRCPDPSANPYLAFAVMLGAGLDGIEKKMKLPAPVEENVYQFNDSKLKQLYINKLPASLEEAVGEMERSEIVKESLGKHIFEHLILAQKSDWDEYRTTVTEWERKRYFPVL
jgi:glutamine synthetase